MKFNAFEANNANNVNSPIINCAILLCKSFD